MTSQPPNASSCYSDDMQRQVDQERPSVTKKAGTQARKKHAARALVSKDHQRDAAMAWDAFLHAGRRLERRFTTDTGGVASLSSTRR